MSRLRDTRTFFAKGTPNEWEYILTKYKDALRLKAQQKNKKPEELLKLDSWYQEELPKLIQSRKEKHLTHDELVQTMKWKLSRGKWRPRLTDLVRINTPSSVLTVSKKAFRRLPNLASAIQTLSSLKGIGPATASAVLAAGAPELAPYMADECLMAIPECQAIDYTVQEYMIFTEQIRRAVERLNESTTNGVWTPHKVEKALWTFSIVNELDPTLLDEIRTLAANEEGTNPPNTPNGDSENSQSELVTNSEESNSSEKQQAGSDVEGGQNGANGEESKVDEEASSSSTTEMESKAASESNNNNDNDDNQQPPAQPHNNDDASGEGANDVADDEDDGEPSSKRTKTK
ncbi:hypothetical protein CHUAL_003085 [Chamberlinius hualienensis]